MKRFCSMGAVRALSAGLTALILVIFASVVWYYIPQLWLRYALLGLVFLLVVVGLCWSRYLHIQAVRFADEVCEAMDKLVSYGEVPDYDPYENSLNTKVAARLHQYYDILRERQAETIRDKEEIQEIISDISHQIKTPIASVKLYTGILQQHDLTEEKRCGFLDLMAAQIDKLDFLIRSMIEMSRLETGIVKLSASEENVYHTIMLAMNGVLARAEEKKIELSVDCEEHLSAKHDAKWTAEALMNILDNAVKYTMPGGSVTVTARPWQFYVRVDITDTGIGIAQEHENDVFKRFYRASEVSQEEGVGLGLYLAQSIVVRQQGYISMKSKPGEGTTFSVYLTK